MAKLNEPMSKPILVFGYGNESRGDDALGPLLIEYLEQHCDLDQVDLLTDFQLQVEHALDLENRKLVIFADASMACQSAFAFDRLIPAKDESYTTHAMSPASVLSVFQAIQSQALPECYLLSLKGEQFDLGAELSSSARQNLNEASQFLLSLLQNPDPSFWQQQLQARSEHTSSALQTDPSLEHA